jgi:hypothetical protein
MPYLTVTNSDGATIEVAIDERVLSRKLTSGDKAKDDLLYVIQGRGDLSLMDDFAAYGAVINYTPLVYVGLIFDHVDAIEAQGGGIWYATAKYVNPNIKQQTGKELVSFDTAGKQQKVSTGISTPTVYAAGGTVSTKPTGINATADRVEGVEVTVPEFKLNLTYYVPNDSVTTSYIGMLYSLTGTVCNAEFFGMDEGECLFLGAKGSRRGRGDWELTFDFAGSPNATGLTVGPISGIDKKGWQYLWVRYQKAVDSTNSVLVETPLLVFIETVYTETDLSGLGIGTTFPVFPDVGP